MYPVGYWRAKINKGQFDIYIDEDGFVYFEGTDGCTSSKDFEYFELIERLESCHYFNVEV